MDYTVLVRAEVLYLRALSSKHVAFRRVGRERHKTTPQSQLSGIFSLRIALTTDMVEKALRFLGWVNYNEHLRGLSPFKGMRPVLIAIDSIGGICHHIMPWNWDCRSATFRRLSGQCCGHEPRRVIPSLAAMFVFQRLDMWIIGSTSTLKTESLETRADMSTTPRVGTDHIRSIPIRSIIGRIGKLIAI